MPVCLLCWAGLVLGLGGPLTNLNRPIFTIYGLVSTFRMVVLDFMFLLIYLQKRFDIWLVSTLSQPSMIWLGLMLTHGCYQHWRLREGVVLFCNRFDWDMGCIVHFTRAIIKSPYNTYRAKVGFNHESTQPTPIWLGLMLTHGCPRLWI